MARRYAQVRPDMWLDDDWRSLTPQAQHLYLVILTDPGLSYAGVTEWKPGRLRQRAQEWDATSLIVAAQECSDRHFLVFDDETEEVAVRSFLRHDGLLKQPRMAVSMALAFGQIGSNKIRAAVVFELQRLKRENPDWEAWSKPQVMTVMKQNAVNPRHMVTDLAIPLGMDLGLRLPIGLPERQGSVSASPTPTPAPTPAPTPSSKEDSAVESNVFEARRAGAA